MALAPNEHEPDDGAVVHGHASKHHETSAEPPAHDPESDNSDGDDDEEDGEEEEPKLKYTRLTGSLASVYRGGDATSAFMVAGDKMVCAELNELPCRVLCATSNLWDVC